MREGAGDLFSPEWGRVLRVITTNGARRNDGACVMGRGVAAEAKARWPELPFQLGRALVAYGNHVHLFAMPQCRVASFPVKHHWRDMASLSLIERSARELVTLCNVYEIYDVLMPRPGCGNGQRAWEDVKPVLEPILDSRFLVIEYATQNELPMTGGGRTIANVRSELL